MRPIKVLVNATTLVVGGGVQVGKSFLDYALNNTPDDIVFLFAVSQAIFDNLSPEHQSLPNIKLVKKSPAGILKGKNSRLALLEMENEFDADIVYSLGFPSYIKFKALEIGRYTNPWEINFPPLPWHLLSLKEKVITYLGVKYRLFWASKAKYFETQTETAKAGIAYQLKISERKVFVVPNSHNELFIPEQEGILQLAEQDKEVTIFCLSAAYKHKNLEIIPSVARILKDKGFLAKFILTLPEDTEILKSINASCKNLGVDEMVKNVGVLRLKDCLHYYKKSNFIFLPTLLEVFSATHLEAMAMHRPIVTTDLSFSRDVCGDAALYFKPMSAKSAAESIEHLIGDQQLQRKLIENGIARLKLFPNQNDKYQMIFDMLRCVAPNEN